MGRELNLKRLALRRALRKAYGKGSEQSLSALVRALGRAPMKRP